MPDEEKGKIIETLVNLDEKDKSFILGYMAGRTADKQEEKTDSASGEGK